MRFSDTMRHHGIHLVAIVILLTTVAHAADVPATQPRPIQCARVVVFGDSISFDNGKKKWTHWTAALKNRFDLTLINAGVGGDTTEKALARIDNEVLKKRPEIVLISFGMNDHVMRAVDKPNVPLDQYEANLVTMVEKIRAAGATPVFVTTNYIFEGDVKDTSKKYYSHRHDPAFYANVGGAQKWLDRYIDAMRSVAKKLDVPVADVRKACDAHDPKVFTSDGVHPAELGQTVYAQVVGDLLEAQFGKSPAAQPVGVRVHTVESEFQERGREVYVLLPDELDASKRYSVLYVLPVYATARAAQAAIEQAKSDDLANRFGLICVAPSFDTIPWYADHATDPKQGQESFVVKAVVPFIDATYPTTADAGGRMLAGFSKSGWGAVTMLLRHPDVFGQAASFDAPLMMGRGGRFSVPEQMGPSSHFDKYCALDLIESRADLFRNQPARLIILGQGIFNDDQVKFHEKLLSLGVPHGWFNETNRKHAWNSGWLTFGVEEMDRAKSAQK